MVGDEELLLEAMYDVVIAPVSCFVVLPFDADKIDDAEFVVGLI